MLLYHGGYIGKLHECVESIRLESIRDGIEDYDYFDLLDAKFGEGTSELMIKQITTSLGKYNSDPELFNKIRLAVGNLIAPDPDPEPVITETDPVTEPETGTETEPEQNEKRTSPLAWIIPVACVCAIACAAVIVLVKKAKKK